MDQVRFDRRGADVQCFPNLFVAVASGDQLQDFYFTGAQTLFGWRAHAGHQASGDGGGQHGFSAGSGANRPEQFLPWGIFEQVAGGPGFDGPQDIGVRVVGGQDKDPG